MQSIFDGKLNIEVAVASGIEAVCKRELLRLGYTPGGANLGRIEFEGDFKDVLRANVFLRTANRVRIVLAKFKAQTFDELFDGIYAMRWQDILTKDARIVVDAKSAKSQLFALRSIQSITKKAIISTLLSKKSVRFCTARGITALRKSYRNSTILHPKTQWISTDSAKKPPNFYTTKRTSKMRSI